MALLTTVVAVRPLSPSSSLMAGSLVGVRTGSVDLDRCCKIPLSSSPHPARDLEGPNSHHRRPRQNGVTNGYWHGLELTKGLGEPPHTNTSSKGEATEVKKDVVSRDRGMSLRKPSRTNCK